MNKNQALIQIKKVVLRLMSWEGLGNYNKPKKWELFILHLINNLKELHLIPVTPNLLREDYS